jgi:hypothetical protein
MRKIPPGEDSTVNLWVQRFDTPVHHLWKAGVVTDFDDSDTGIAE